MKNYSSTPAKWLSGFVTFAIIMLGFAFIMTIFSPADFYSSFKILGMSYHNPIQTTNTIVNKGRKTDSLFTYINKSEEAIEAKELNAELYSVRFDYKLEDDKYSDVHFFFKIFISALTLVLIYQLFLFRKVLRNFVKRNPFSFENVKTLRKAAYISIGLIAVDIIFSNIISVMQNNLFEHKMYFLPEYFPNISTNSLLVAIFFFSIAEILKMGINYKKENELTV